jgi:hypothetical protein
MTCPDYFLVDALFINTLNKCNKMLFLMQDSSFGQKEQNKHKNEKCYAMHFIDETKK